MYKVDVDQTICRIFQIFYWFGIWRNDVEFDDRQSCIRLLYLLLQISVVIFFITLSILSDDKNQQILLVELAILMGVVSIKLWYLLYRKSEIVKFLRGHIVTHCIPDGDESMEVNTKIRRFLKFIAVYTISVIATVILLSTAPLPLFTSEKLLPMFIRFDVEGDYATILYWMTYIYVAVGCMFNGVYNCTMVLIWCIMFNYSIKYKMLGNQFRSLGYVSVSKGTSNNITRNLFQEDLIGLIKVQQNLIEYDAVYKLLIV